MVSIKKAEQKLSFLVLPYFFSSTINSGTVVLSGVTGTSDGIMGDALQISPALTMTPEEMDVAIAILKEAIISVTDI